MNVPFGSVTKSMLLNFCLAALSKFCEKANAHKSNIANVIEKIYFDFITIIVTNKTAKRNKANLGVREQDGHSEALPKNLFRRELETQASHYTFALRSFTCSLFAHK